MNGHWGTAGTARLDSSPEPTRHDEVVERFTEAGVELLTVVPPSAITGRRLAEAAGVNYGMLHRHVGTKKQALHLALDRLTERFTADAFGTPDGLPRPSALRRHRSFLRATTLVALDRASFTGYHDRSPVLRHYATALARTRPELDRRDLELSVALSASLLLGDSLYRTMLAPAIGLDPCDPHIDRLVAASIDGLHAGTGPLGSLPLEPRRLRPAIAIPQSERTTGRGREHAEQRLVLAGAQLLRHRAPSAISGRDLAKAAGVNYGLVHHYFGSKDRVLLQSLEWLRGRFFALTSQDPQGAEYFEVRDHPGFVRAMTWRALELTDVDLADGYPTLNALLERLTAAYGPPHAGQRAAVVVSVATQIAWALYEPFLELAFETPTDDLVPFAAAALHRLVATSAAG